jgi:hypothetical protein
MLTSARRMTTGVGMQDVRLPTDKQVRARHRNDMLLKIVGPVALTALIMVAVFVTMILALSPSQFSTIANCLSVMLLIPVVVTCLVPYVVLMALFGVTRKAYFWLPDQLRTARGVVHRANLIAQQLSSVIARPVIAVNQRIAWLEGVVRRKPRGATVPLLPERINDRGERTDR